MAIPSKNFTVIADASIDVDSPLTTGLFVKFRDNDIHLEEWLGLSFVAAQDHDHDGVNSAGINLLPKNAEDVTNRDTTSTSFIDLSGASVTYTAAELSINRECLTIVALEVTRPSSSTAIDIDLALNIDGVDKQFMTQIVNADNEQQSVILAGQNTLTSGANRIVKVRFRSGTSGNVRVARSYLQAFLLS